MPHAHASGFPPRVHACPNAGEGQALALREGRRFLCILPASRVNAFPAARGLLVHADKTMQEKIRTIIESSGFSLFIQLLILASAFVFAFESGRPTPDPYARYFKILDIGFLTLFTVEYLLRIWGAPKKRAFIFSFFGIVDLLAILPAMLFLLPHFRMLRILRFLRIFRILKVTRFILAVDRLTTALNDVKTELFALVILSLMFVYLAACGIHYFEKDTQPEAFGSIFSSMWWAIVTLTTIGYGDVYPVTVGGRVFAALVAFVGVGIIAIPAGLLASVLTEARTERRKSEETETNGKEED